jgi:hypothetical protein
MDRKKQNKDKKNLDDFIKYSSLGFEMLVIIVAGTFGGYKIDQWMNNDVKVFTLVLMVLSVVLSTLYGIRNFLKK